MLRPQDGGFKGAGDSIAHVDGAGLCQSSQELSIGIRAGQHVVRPACAGKEASRSPLADFALTGS